MKLTVVPLLLTCSLVLPTAAVAEPSAGYYAEVDNNTVIICPHLRNDRGCPQAEGMLRQDVDSRAAVRLPQSCTHRRVRPSDGTQVNAGACYIDLCVPPGTYRYGYNRPLECVGSSTYYYTQVTVTAPLAKDCQPSAGAASPAARAPWGTSAYVCVGGCGAELARSPHVSWGLLLLLITGTSVVLLYHRYGRGRGQV